ncbi:hypothetical protein HHI36_000498 [Cryptolaemus montrouzieri]|uniref:Myb-like domain-containing protein n=1 Tax=Cryptolaemus montrouzieri TaxID=559131 RepID=A0ABD2P5A5_9CUCU
MRRTRIKGVANIPQRKKVDLSQKAEEDGKNKTDVTITGHDGSIKACPTKSENTETETKIAQEEIIERTEKADIHKSIDVHSKVCPPQLENIEAGRKIIKEEIIQRTGIADIDNSKNVSGFDCSTEQKELQKIIKEDILSFEETEEDKNISAASSTENEKNISILENVIVRNASEALESFEIVNETTSSSLIENVIEEPKKKLLPLTRAIKPKIPVCPSNKRAQKGEEILKNINNNENVNRIDINSDINEKSEREAHEKTASKEQNVLVHPQSPQISINSPGIRRLKSPVNNVMNIRKIASPHASGGSDTEYPPPPASPNKVNRNRIKAIPRLGYRKISFSASESEDESKRSSQRTRNDSQSSNISEIQESIPEQPMTPKAKEFSSVIHRKCRRTEWSRKLAEARREFTRKFLYGKPDHKKLTMIDLIFYNPTTNQLKKENKTSISETKEDEKTEEDVDNPSEKEEDPPDNSQVEEDTKISDEENEMPAPQIKIGPSGEIILDEKSLTIENKQTKKNREDLQKSKLIDGNSDRPYGVFRKIKRSKDWSQSETLRFYKALSTIGTDFSLMCELFPNRTRRELKMKFKKEEKINQSLIDQAVMEPCSFDFEELKKEFQLVEIEKRELEKQK